MRVPPRLWRQPAFNIQVWILDGVVGSGVSDYQRLRITREQWPRWFGVWSLNNAVTSIFLNKITTNQHIMKDLIFTHFHSTYALT